MTQQSVFFQQVSFTYETALGPLFEDLSVHFASGWTGIVGPNGVGKTTILKLATGLLAAERGIVRSLGTTIYCPQRTDDIPPLFDRLLSATDAEAFTIKGRLEIQDDWPRRWHTLSHGERKRAQIGVALWRRPDVLAIDEPTNHLDAAARALLAEGLTGYSGVGLLVSHDCELLDSLCAQCLFLEPPSATLRPGGYSTGAEQARIESEENQREFVKARREHQRLRREAQRRREEADKSCKRVSMRGVDPKDNAMRAKLRGARVTSRDAVAGNLLRQMQGRVSQAEDRLSAVQVKKTHELGVWMEGEVSSRNLLFEFPAASLPLGERGRLEYPDLMMRPTDRVALSGRNGGGKSTLIRRIVESLNLPEHRVVYVPQEIRLEESQDILERARRLPGDALGRMMAVVSRLNSRPERLLESDEPSPGEIRKLLLALGIAAGPHLVIMDEPTNHLDLPSIECLEEALSGCPCGLLLVSHDQRFLSRLTTIAWHIEPDPATKPVVHRLQIRTQDQR